MDKTVAQVMAEALCRHEVEYIFGQCNPTALMLAAEDNGIRQLLYRTENAAGAMADAYSRVSNKIGVVAAQNGPAATLMVAPMAEAIQASIPMLVLVQEVPASQRDKNAFQELDHFALFSGVSKWTRRIDDPDRATDYVDMAMTVANSGRPGPVVLLIAKDMLMQPSKLPSFTRTDNLGSFPLDRARPEKSRVELAAKLLGEAESPLIIAGGGVHLSQATSELNELVELAQIPLATTNMGKGVVAEHGPWTLGVAANFMGENGPAALFSDLISNADVVLFIGSRTNENGTDSWTLTSPNATYIHIDIDSLEVGRNYAAHRLVGDAKLTLIDLIEALKNTDLKKRTSAGAALKKDIAAAKEQRLGQIKSLVESDIKPIMPQRLMGDIDALINENDIVVADASYSSAWVSCFITAQKTGQRIITPRGIAGLGWGLPYAIGAKLASPTSRVISVVGDGGFAHVWAEIETAVREQIPVVVIVLNNSQLVMQKHGEAVLFKRTCTAIEFSSVDHAGVARSAGAKGIRIEDPDQFEPAMKEALESNEVYVLDVICNQDAYAPLRAFTGHERAVEIKAAKREL